MQTQHQRKTFWSWYLFNLLGWAVGFSGGFILTIYYGISLSLKYPSSSIIYKLADIVEIFLPFLTLIVCLGLTQWLQFRQWQVQFDIYKWIAANVKGTFIAMVLFILIGAFVGEFQRPILDFLYHQHFDIDQTELILGLISIMLPLLGSLGTSVMVAVDILEWKFGRRNLAT